MCFFPFSSKSLPFPTSRLQILCVSCTSSPLLRPLRSRPRSRPRSCSLSRLRYCSCFRPHSCSCSNLLVFVHDSPPPFPFPSPLPSPFLFPFPCPCPSPLTALVSVLDPVSVPIFCSSMGLHPHSSSHPISTLSSLPSPFPSCVPLFASTSSLVPAASRSPSLFTFPFPPSTPFMSPIPLPTQIPPPTPFVPSRLSDPVTSPSRMRLYRCRAVRTELPGARKR